MGAPVTTYQFPNRTAYDYAVRFYNYISSRKETEAYAPQGLQFTQPPALQVTYSNLDTYTPTNQSDLNIIYAVSHCLLWEGPTVKFCDTDKLAFIDKFISMLGMLKIENKFKDAKDAITQLVKRSRIRFAPRCHGRLFLLNVRMYNGIPVYLPPGGDVPLPCREWDEASLLLSIIIKYETDILKTWKDALDINPPFKAVPIHKLFMVFQLAERTLMLRHMIDFNRSRQIIVTLLENLLDTLKVKTNE